MRKTSVMAVAAVFAFAGALWACDKDAKVAKSAGKVAPCCKAKYDAAVAKVVNSLPSMAYQVGDMRTRCFKSATAKAGKAAQVRFVVAEKIFDSETEATLALAELLEKRADNLKTVQYAVGDQSFHCRVSAQSALKDGQQMKYHLAGFSFDTREQADKALQIINCKLRGCPEDCIKDCIKNFPKSAVLSSAGKPGCNKSKAQVAASTDLPCHKGKAGATTVAAAEKKPCSARAKATTVAAGETKPCCAKGKAGASTAAAGGSPYGQAKATVAAAKSSPCSKAAKATTVAKVDGLPCGQAKATVAAAKSSPCSKAAKATTVAKAKGSPCGQAKATVAAAKSSPCSKAAKATTVAARTKGGCCEKAQQRLASIQDQIRLIVETAAASALNS